MPAPDIWVVFGAFFSIQLPKAQVRLSDNSDSSCKTAQKMVRTQQQPLSAGAHPTAIAARHGTPSPPAPSLPYSLRALWRRYSKAPARMDSSICSTVGENQMPSTWNSRPITNTTTHTVTASATTSMFEERESSTA